MSLNCSDFSRSCRPINLEIFKRGRKWIVKECCDTAGFHDMEFDTVDEVLQYVQKELNEWSWII